MKKLITAAAAAVAATALGFGAVAPASAVNAPARHGSMDGNVYGSTSWIHYHGEAVVNAEGTSSISCSAVDLSPVPAKVDTECWLEDLDAATSYNAIDIPYLQWSANAGEFLAAPKRARLCMTISLPSSFLGQYCTDTI